METQNEEIGVLKPGEAHPSASDALRYVEGLGYHRQSLLLEAFSSLSIEGNRSAEICGETLRRVMTGHPVGDRYVLGLAWGIHTNGFLL